MPFEESTLAVRIACTSFLESYPYPAFALSKPHAGYLASDLVPIYSNPSWKNLIFGPNANEPTLGNGGLLEFLISADGAHGIEEATKFGEWIEESVVGSVDYNNTRTHLLVLQPSWLTDDQPPIQLELVKTPVDHFWVITSVPRTQIPQYMASPVSPEHDGGPNSRITASVEAGDPKDDNGEDTPTSYATVGQYFSTNAGSLEPLVQQDSEMHKMMVEFPWHNSPLGPISQWPQSLKSAISYVMGMPSPMALWWGPELTMLYNDCYRETIASKHPFMFGKSGSLAFGEIWHKIGPIAREILAGRIPHIAKKDDLFFINRLTEKNLPEEVYPTWHWVPVAAEDGRVGGLINGITETTVKVIAARRLLLLQDVGDRTVLARNKKEYASAVMSAFGNDAVDVPFAVLYFTTTEPIPTPSSVMGSVAQKPRPPLQNIVVSLQLAGSIGIPPNHADTPERIEVCLHPVTRRSIHTPPASRSSTGHASSSDTPQASRDEDSASVDEFHSARSDISPPYSASPTMARWPLFDAFASQSVIHVKELPLSISNSLIRRGWGDCPREAVVIQLASEGDDIPSAILILGLNTRRPYDKDYETWVDILRIGLSATLTASMAREAEKLKTEQLAQLDAAKTNFFSSASHELRTPLTLIAGPIDDVLAVTQDPKPKELLKLAARNVARLARLVDSLMQFSRLEAGRLEGQFRAIHLGEFTKDLCTLFKGTIEKSNIEFAVEINLNDDRVVWVDPDFWEKIVFNIIGNAFKYTLQGSIKVMLTYDDKYCLFIVQDTGVGIPEHDLEKIFDRFHRVASVSRSHEGTGIGLSLTRELVKLHQGEIYVESSIANEATPSGSTFTVAIPLGKSHLARDLINEHEPEASWQMSYARGIVDEASHWGSGSKAEETLNEGNESSRSSDGDKGILSLFNFSKKDLILVADDNSDVKAYIGTIFSQLCTVIEASNGQEAFELATKGPKPDLILADVMMPIMDGYGLINALREYEDTRLIPVILLTARAGEEARMEGLLSGADDYVEKPFRSRELIARAHLQMQIGKRKLEMQSVFDQRSQEIQVLSDLSPVGIFRQDFEGNITYTNKQWCQITGHSADSPWSEWVRDIHPDDAAETLELWQSCLEEKKGGYLDMRWRNGIWTKFQIEPLSDGLIATITDTTDRHLYEAAQLAQARERELIARQRAIDAEEREREADTRRRAQELLVDVTSHELRQPVNAILNCSALVRSNLGHLLQDLEECVAQQVPFNPGEELLEAMGHDLDALDSIYQCGLAQERIANDVLSLSRIQLQVLSIHPMDFPLVPEVKRILSIFTNELKMKDIALEIKFGKSIEIYGVTSISADTARFAQVITNLLSNAIKFTDTSPPPNRRIQVTIEVSPKPPLDSQCQPAPDDNGQVIKIRPGSTVYIFVSVKDSGPGVSPDDLAILFQRFQQGSNSHDVFGGSGLGLFVSRKLCDLMGGNISVDSVYGEGATFRFYISAIAKAPKKLQVTAALKIKSPYLSQKSTPSFSVNGIPHPSYPSLLIPDSPPTARTAYHVLITEDNLINQTILNRQLKQAGFVTTLASNGQQALTQIKKLALGGNESNGIPRQFDVILMDCEMPVMDGLTAVREIRRMEASGELPFRNRVIAVTANARSGQMESTREAGMDDVVIKPYKLEELLSKIRQHPGDESI